ncbi:L-fucose mutarotase [Formosa agariphila KMM 3901]|uniref:L-fucose mutarotase n=1 Tax=Formosa agariphila (strain DSM 15362 / KCTC 12365 / LMG 23005 / KMM 3901 / M-2Alg 35-1) TaxID=1347342 RepID=T2KGG9_FORAG|nr:L-fucose mutarotase [Formosa agariphila]CDF77850.1 L-fucose mutarotase [Formosa agariphila KMM 3901]
MLRGISPLISPELLKVLAEMGHGEEIVFADAHFPAYTYNTKVLRLDGVKIPDLLLGVLPLFMLDSYDPSPLIMMDAVPGDTLDANVQNSYLNSIHHIYPEAPEIKHIERFAFYERTIKAYAVVVTGETAKYGNIILKKGVTPIL